MSSHNRPRRCLFSTKRPEDEDDEDDYEMMNVNISNRCVLEQRA
jgi:hypothetical protein